MYKKAEFDIIEFEVEDIIETSSESAGYDTISIEDGMAETTTAD